MRSYLIVFAFFTFTFFSCQPTAKYQQTKTDKFSEVKSKPTPQPSLYVPGETVEKSLKWLIEAQNENGAWGAGSHAKQQIRDPRAVQVDPATTAFAGMALIRSGNTLKSGVYSQQLMKALDYLLETVEKAPETGNNITTLTGTQPQVKLGQNIDASMASRFFTRILPHAEYDQQLKSRIIEAQNKCLRKIQGAQAADGSISGGTWAGVLQSAVATMALEEAAEAGDFKVDSAKLQKIREYNAGNVDIQSGAVSTDKAAGVSLYSYSSTTRSTAKQARKTKDVLQKAQAMGTFGEVEMDDIEITEENLQKAGMKEEEAKEMVRDFRANEVAKRQVQQERVMTGYGNNGGEEFLSHMMTSESLVVTGGEEWQSWNQRIKTMLASIQNPDGSYSGHHCITSPVFCTAAVILTLTVENDPTLIPQED
ncbi:MAG: hypothetical protein R3B93_17660 [Bacteroidia bacterium]